MGKWAGSYGLLWTLGIPIHHQLDPLIARKQKINRKGPGIPGSQALSAKLLQHRCLCKELTLGRQSVHGMRDGCHRVGYSRLPAPPIAIGFLLRFVLGNQVSAALATTSPGKQPANGILSRHARATLAVGF